MTKASRFVHSAPLRPRTGITWGNVPEETIDEREAVPQFFDRYGDCESVALVGTATRSRRSHVEVLAEMLEEFQKE